MLPKQIGKKLLEGVDAYVCEDCLKRNSGYFQQQRIKPQKSAPFNQAELTSLLGYQKCQVFYPYVCHKGHELKPTQDGLICDSCSFIMKSAYLWTLNGAWKPHGYRDFNASSGGNGSAVGDQAKQFVGT
jgi:hypothetical protein